jgi:hypothetical protein
MSWFVRIRRSYYYLQRKGIFRLVCGSCRIAFVTVTKNTVVSTEIVLLPFKALPTGGGIKRNNHEIGGGKSHTK